LAIALAMCAPARVLQAQDLPEPPTTLVYRAPSGCSSAGDFARRVERRSRRVRLTTQAGAQRSLIVEIQPLGRSKRFHGTVSVLDAGGALAQRELDAKSCEEAVEALVLIATVTLDSDALIEDHDAASLPAPEPAPSPAKPAPLESRRILPFRERPVPGRAARMSFGIEAALLVRFAPEPAFGGAAFAALELPERGWLAPALRVSLVHAQARGIAEPGGHANFAFSLAALDACPTRLRASALALRPCAFASAGVVEAWGRTARNETHVRFFGSAGALVWATARIGKTVEIVLDGRAAVPWVRDRYGFDGVSFFSTASPIFFAGLGVAAGFP
jgi:hypothetical protein